MNQPTLCTNCEFVKLVHSDKGSTFLQCTLAKTDKRFGKYPPQPVVRCVGYRQR